MKASLSRFAQRARPYALSIALACAVTAAAGVAWAQTRITPTGVGVSGSVIGDDVLYSIGGGRAVSMGGAGNMQSIGVGIGWNSNLICGDMSITTTLQNQLNGITNGFQQIMSNVIQSATSAVASLPALIIQRADPGLYNLLTNGVLQARLDFDRSKLTCKAMANRMADWPAPPALLPPTQGTPSLPRRVSACSTADTASLLPTASRKAMPSAIWLQPSWPPAVSAIFSAMARHVSLERSKSSRACSTPLVSRLYRPGSAR